MSLESCPTCGFALSILSHECRHCPAASTMHGWFEHREAKLLAAVSLLAVVGAALYRHFHP